MLIKVCGLTDAVNIQAISDFNVDMIGYNFYPHSQRFLREAQVFEVDSSKKKVGVFVNESMSTIIEKTARYQLDLIQLHGVEGPDFTEAVQRHRPVIKVFRIDTEFDAQILYSFAFCDYYLFDTATPLFGGSGQVFDWNILLQFEIPRPFFISGGIGPSDVEKIKKFQHPYFVGIDINSKFEIKPGLKNVDLVRSFSQDIKSFFNDLPH